MIKVELVAGSFEELKEKVATLAISLGFGGFTEPAETSIGSVKKEEPAISSDPVETTSP